MALAGKGLGAGFTTDDLVNLPTYFNQTPAALVKANILYCSPFYRPMGAVFYRPLFALFGFRPLPYRIFCFALLLGNLALAYLAIQGITASAEMAAIATLIGAFHPRLVDLYWNNGTIYDILCFTFFFGALLYYVRVRRSGPILDLRHTAVFLALYVAALDSKEIAVSLPVVVILYELIYFAPAERALRDLIQWATTECRLALVAGIMTAPYIWAKLLPQSPFSQLTTYHFGLSPHLFLATLGAYLDALFYQDHWFGMIQTALLLAAMLGLALLLRSRHLVFAWAFLLFSFLPIAWIPARAAYVLYIPLVGWSLYTGALLASIRELLFSSRMPLAVVRFAQCALFLLVLLGLLRAYRVQRLRMYGETTLAQPAIRSVLAQLDKLHPALPHGARVLALNDPLPQKYDLLCLLRLYFHDATLQVDQVSSDDGHEYVMAWCRTGLVLLPPAATARAICPGGRI